MVAQKYRWDFIGLSTDQKPTASTSEKVVDGSTYYCSDTSKLYVWCKDNWYERKPLGGGGGGGSYTAGNGIDITDDTISVDTTTIQAKLTAGSNVTISDNTISATDTTYNNFTGTDGTAAGAAGLVPAPATTDAGKFLKADGTWDNAGGGASYTAGDGIDITNDIISATNTGKARVLTSADYNYPTDNPTYVALWLLEPGVYAADNMSASINVRTHINSSDYHSGVFIVSGRQDTYSSSTLYKVPIIVKDASVTKFVVAYGSGGFSSIFNLDDCLLKSAVTQATGTSTSWVMSQNAVTNMLKMGVLSTTPTGTTVGFPGRLYTLDTGGGSYEVYLCVHDNGDNTYVWKQVSLI